MEHDLRPVPGKDLVQQDLVLDLAQDRDIAVEPALVLELHLDAVQVGLPGVVEDDGPRPETQDLAAQLRADGPPAPVTSTTLSRR